MNAKSQLEFAKYVMPSKGEYPLVLLTSSIERSNERINSIPKILNE